MRHLLFLFSLVFLTACSSSNRDSSISYDLRGARDAFDYPNLSEKNDTDIYVYQLKNILDRQDSFIYVTTGLQYLKQFGEENLSLRPLPLETFRFSFCPFNGPPVNITFNKKELVVKLGLSGLLYPMYNEQKLDSLEAVKFLFLQRRYFRSRQTLSEKKLRSYDSMITKYPELTSIKYYKSLIDKCTDYDTLRFKYSIARIALTNQQYSSLLVSLKRSGFDSVPWHMLPSEVSMDGVGYTFEANTKTKYKFFNCFGSEPMNTTAMTNFCRYLLKMANVDKQIDL